MNGKLRQVAPKGPTLSFQYNPETVTRISSVPRYRTIERPGRKDALEYAGHSAEGLGFTLIFDGWPDRVIEAKCELLEDMLKRRSQGKPPPDLKLDYGSYGGGKSWRLSDLEWGDSILDEDLNRVRQIVTVTLIELVDAAITLTPANKHKQKKGKKKAADQAGGIREPEFRLNTIKAGDTLPSIAQRLLGDAARWPEIAELNGIRDPNSLRLGRTIQVPKA